MTTKKTPLLKPRRPSARKTTKQRLLADVAGNGGAEKRLNAVVEAALYSSIQQRALDEKRSISAITREMWIKRLSKPAKV